MSENKSEKVLVIGLDGATWDVIDPLIGLGIMPNMKRLKEIGTCGILKSTIPPVTAPAWATFYTGKNPGKHGIIHFYDLKDTALEKIRKDKVTINNYSSIDLPTIFDYFYYSDRKICSINMPMTYPPPYTNGNVISCWLTPSGADDFTYPPSLREEIPDYQIDLFLGKRLDYSKSDLVKISDAHYFFPEIISLLNKRINTTISLINGKEWDLFMVCFTETDFVQHFYMKLLKDLTRNGEDVELFKQFYKTLDNGIDKIIKQVGDDCPILIISDHGFTQCVHNRFNINAWLKKEGIFILNDDIPSQIKETYLGISHRLKWHTNKFMGKKINYTRNNIIEDSIDWSKTQAYGINLHNMFGGIVVNDNNYKLIDIIMSKLKDLKTPEGKQLVKNVWHREELISGKYSNIYPEILFELIDGYEAGRTPIDYKEKEIFSINLGDWYKEYMYSNHDREGIILASGSGIEKNRKLSKMYSLEDLLPTIFYIMNMEIPEDCDGMVMEDLFLKEINFNKKMKKRLPLENTKIIRRQTSENYDEEIKNKLSGLGYM